MVSLPELCVKQFYSKDSEQRRFLDNFIAQIPISDGFIAKISFEHGFIAKIPSTDGF